MALVLSGRTLCMLAEWWTCSLNSVHGRHDRVDTQACCRVQALRTSRTTAASPSPPPSECVLHPAQHVSCCQPPFTCICAAADGAGLQRAALHHSRRPLSGHVGHHHHRGGGGADSDPGLLAAVLPLLPGAHMLRLLLLPPVALLTPCFLCLCPCQL